MLEYELDIVQKELDKGNKVVFLHCTGGLQQCGANNPKGGHLKNRYCSECKSRVYDGIKWLNAKSGMLEVADSELIFEDQKQSINFILQNIDNLRTDINKLIQFVNIDGVDIYEAAKSAIQTKFICLMLMCISIGIILRFA